MKTNREIMLKAAYYRTTIDNITIIILGNIIL